MKISYRQSYRATDLGFWLARLAGFEPATRCLEGSCSIRLSYRRLPNVLCRIQVTQRIHRPDLLAASPGRCKPGRHGLRGRAGFLVMLGSRGAQLHGVTGGSGPLPRPEQHSEAGMTGVMG
jgi:hypothetical protein